MNNGVVEWVLRLLEQWCLFKPLNWHLQQVGVSNIPAQWLKHPTCLKITLILHLITCLCF
jgi:hypothetical protein